jgi:hypothetical protein
LCVWKGREGRVLEKRKEKVELKDCIRGGFLRVYLNSSNLIYAVIIFSILKIY